MISDDFQTWKNSLSAIAKQKANGEINQLEYYTKVLQANGTFILTVSNPLSTTLLNKVFTKAKDFIDPPLTGNSNFCPSNYSELTTVNLPNIPQPEYAKPKFKPPGKIYSQPAKIIPNYIPIPLPELPIRRLPSSNNTPSINNNLSTTINNMK